MENICATEMSNVKYNVVRSSTFEALYNVINKIHGTTQKWRGCVDPKVKKYTILSIYLLTPWCRVLLEKLTGLQLVKKLPAFHGTRRFITALTSVRHLPLSWASPIQSIYPHPTSWRSILILSTHLRLGLPSSLLPSCFPSKTLYTPLSSPKHATCPAHLIHLKVITFHILRFNFHLSIWVLFSRFECDFYITFYV